MKPVTDADLIAQLRADRDHARVEANALLREMSRAAVAYNLHLVCGELSTAPDGWHVGMAVAGYDETEAAEA